MDIICHRFSTNRIRAWLYFNMNSTNYGDNMIVSEKSWVTILREKHNILIGIKRS